MLFIPSPRIYQISVERNSSLCGKRTHPIPARDCGEPRCTEVVNHLYELSTEVGVHRRKEATRKEAVVDQYLCHRHG